MRTWVRLASIAALALVAAIAQGGEVKESGATRTEVLGELRAALIDALSRPAPATPPTLAELERAARAPAAYGVAVQTLRLRQPRPALPLLVRMLDDANRLVAIEAAATLALLGERRGLGMLIVPTPALSNSCIEAFYVHAARALLGEPLPAQRPRSVFREREALLDRLADKKETAR